jgi:hypothetical protein
MARRRQYWAEVHDERGLFLSVGTFLTAAAAKTEAERRRDMALANVDTVAQLLAVRLGSPKRADPGAIVAGQSDASHLPLFVAANEPVLL